MKENVDNHCFNNATGKWIKQTPELQPYINLTVSTWKKDFENVGYELHSKEVSTNLPVLADNGCKSKLAILQILSQLNLKTSD